ncbi:MAG: Gfo/Idh/MocA family oxidoreductase [Candidatus Hydrogenedentes bacterium]|nr:Gfo/Idh/MocA family oxidoreductase [Candidatus Hydrogenedentota bacterium]
MLRIGILGAGHFAEAHLEALAQLPARARLTRVARRRLDAEWPRARELGARLTEPEELVGADDVDAVAVCVPNHLHRHCAEAALRAGKHVFCEKPLALSLDDVDVLIKTAAATKRTLMVGHLTRFVEVYTRIAEIVRSGKLGDPLAVYMSRLQVGSDDSWRMDGSIGGGAPFDLMIHDFDLLNWFLGPPESVVAQGHRHSRGAYDHLVAVVNYVGGAVAVVEGSFLLRPGASLRAALRIIGSKGVLELDSQDRQRPIRVQVEGQAEERPAVNFEDYRTRGLVSEYTEFFDVIEGRPSGRLRLEDARRAVETAVLAVRAAESGNVVKFG